MARHALNTAIAALMLTCASTVSQAPWADAAGSAGLVISPTRVVNFTTFAGITTAPQTIFVTNRGKNATTLNGSFTVGPGEPFIVEEHCQGVTLAPGESCEMNVRFSPPPLFYNASINTPAGGSWNGQSYTVTLFGNSLPRLRVSPTALEFGQVNTSILGADQNIAVTNVSPLPVVMTGSAGSITGDNSFLSSTTCVGATLAPGASCTMTVAFGPSTAGVKTAALAGRWADQSYSIDLRGTGTGGAATGIVISPTGLDFGVVTSGATSEPQTVTVENFGASPVMLGTSSTGASGSFDGSTDCNNVQLNSGERCSMTYTFTPGAADSHSATGSWGGQAFSISLRGTIGGRLHVNTNELAFGDEAVGGTTPAQAVTVTNVTSSPITMTVSPGGTATFPATNGCAGQTLAPGGSCQLLYRFHPSALGAASAALAATINGNVSTINVVGAGVNVPSTPRSLTASISDGAAIITWQPPDSDGGSVITGYQVTSVPAGFDVTLPASARTTTLPILPATPSRFIVAAVNANGTGTGATSPTITAYGEYVPVQPERLLETRAPKIGYTGPKPEQGQTVELQVTGAGITNVPADASAVVLNITGTEATATGFVTAWPCGQPQPTASNLNLTTGSTAPNLTIVKVGTGGKICLFTQSGTHLIADINGWFPATSSYHAVQPDRLLDTRDPQVGYTGPKPALGQTVELQVTGVGTTNVPADASAVVLNITGTEATATGFVTVWPCGQPQPTASNLNLTTGSTAPNLTIVKVGTGGKICLFTQSGTHLIADINGWFPA